MAALPTPIRFTLGSRHLLSIPRKLVPFAFSLEDVLAAQMPEPGYAQDADGMRMLSAPLGMVDAITARYAGYVMGGRQDYRRFYIDMTGSFEDYLARFSGWTRSTLRRKARKLADEAEGALDMSEHRTPAEIEAFLAEALPLSALTYQARLLDAGLPDDAAGRSAMLERAEQGQMRCFLLLGPLAAFDGSVAAARALAERSGALAQARKLLRG